MAVVSEESCIGCGLCVARCPVGAIHLDPDTALAIVTHPDPERYLSVPYEDGEFETRRDGIGSALGREAAPFEDGDQALVQLARLERGVASSVVDAQRVYRRLARNTFLILGLPARLKVIGDNSGGAELLVGDADRVIVVEVEPGGDVLDALRRVIAAVARIIGEQALKPGGLIPCIVVAHLPNERVDFYRVVADAASRIRVKVRTVPVSALLLAIRGQGRRLLDGIEEELLLVSGEKTSLAEAVSGLWGPLSDPAGLGLTPAK
jgi:ferredoxin